MLKIRDYSKDERAPQVGVIEVVKRRVDANGFPQGCDHCAGPGPFVRVGAHFRVFLCSACLELARAALGPSRTPFVEATQIFRVIVEDWYSTSCTLTRSTVRRIEEWLETHDKSR